MTTSTAPSLPTSAFMAALARTGTDIRVLTEPADTAPFLTDWRGKFHGSALGVVQPGNTADVAALVALCAEHGIGIVAQGGNTGLCGGATPLGTAAQIVLSLGRMNRIRNVDLQNGTLTAEAGCVLQTVQQCAADQRRLFPLSLAAEGSAQIGGVLSTNAGGTAVLRYGNARAMVLGLEVVLANGEIWHGLRGLRKDNTGYDLNDLFIGSEGTLGIITAAVLKLYPMPTVRAAALVALGSVDAAIALLTLLHEACGERLTAFEVFSRDCLAMSVAHHADLRDPFEAPHAWYALLELSDAAPTTPLASMLEGALERAMTEALVDDAVLAATEAQRHSFWGIRESITEAQKRESYTLKHDVSVPVSAVPAFLNGVMPELSRCFPGIRIAPFGHFGDGNIHLNVAPPPLPPGVTDALLEHQIGAVVYAAVQAQHGSFSAEHGVGQLKTTDMEHYKDPVELRLFRSIKQALDPRGLMNPGKMLTAPRAATFEGK